MSEIECVREIDNKGREVFKFKNEVKAVGEKKTQKWLSELINLN